MAEFAKRPEVTVSTMGKVHNPSGSGVAVKSSSGVIKDDRKSEHETKVKEIGSSRRNITRKKSDENCGNFDPSRKKQGGSGKGIWSVNSLLGEEDEPVVVLDKKDPLYDEHQQHEYFLSSSDQPSKTASTVVEEDNIMKKVYGPMLTLPEFKIRVMDSLREYFQSSDVNEFLLSLEELRCPEYHSEVIKRAITLACDEGPRERELTSRLLTELHPRVLSDKDVSDGVEHLLEGMDELSIDLPDAHSLVGAFLARAVVDEVLPPAFLAKHDNCQIDEDAQNGNGYQSCIECAMRLLSREHCTARLERVWGPGDGRPVNELKQSMDQLLKEYLLSRELDEAARCVRELNSSHFHHELIKRAIIIAMEQDGGNQTGHNPDNPDASVDAMAALFAFLVQNAIVSENQLEKGLSRFHASNGNSTTLLEDITLDVPDAPVMIQEFEDLLKSRGLLQS